MIFIYLKRLLDQLSLVRAKHGEIGELNREIELLRAEREKLRLEVHNLKKLNDSFAQTAQERREVRLRKCNSVAG